MQVATLPELSVTVITTVFAPVIEQSKDEISKVIEAIPQLSVEPLSTSAPVMLTVPVIGSRSKVRSWHIATGASLSNTVTLKEHVEVLPSLSVTERFTVVLPTGNILPLAGVAIISPEMFPSSTSNATPAKFAAAPQVPGELFTTMSDGQAITGALPITIIGNPETFN
ncbi:hypothetical protein AEQU1_00005 [Aequorivita sp. CIP111184]|nr:hypothetical protein AEQU1_00005 [Aequorivita sp. CIP111184]